VLRLGKTGVVGLKGLAKPPPEKKIAGK